MENRIGGILLDLDRVDLPSVRDLLDLSLERIGQFFPGVPVFTSGKPVEDLSFSGEDFETALGSMARQVCENPGDSIVLFYGLAPFLDESLCKETVFDHFDSLADYTISDNVPPGLSPDMVRFDTIQSLPEGSGKDLRAHILSHLNDLEVELFYRLPDIRQLRLDFSCRDSRSTRLVRSCLETGNPMPLPLDGWKDFFLKYPGTLRPAPSYLELELTTRGNARPLYLLPASPSDLEMDFNLIGKILGDIAGEGLTKDLSVSLGGRGEPVLHSRFMEILHLVTGSPAVKMVYLESYGEDLDQKMMESLFDPAIREKLVLILRVPSIVQDTYEKLHGSRVDFQRVLQNVEWLEKRLGEGPGPAIYLETPRILEVESELDDFKKRFQGSRVNLLIQKYNTWLDKLPQRRVSDLTPLYRDFCWHLARDTFVNVEGVTPLCRQDPENEHGTGFDLKQGNLMDVWRDRHHPFQLSLSGDYKKINVPCLKCDEWYTFNA